MTQVVIFTDSASLGFVRYAGAYQVATVLRKQGYTVQVIDHFLMAGLQRTLDLIDKFVGPETLFVGFSTTFMNTVDLHHTMKDTRPEAFTFKGSPDPTKRHKGSFLYAGGIPVSTEEMDVIRARIKSRNSRTALVMGGAKAEILNQPQMDYYVLGHADQSAVSLATYLQGRNPFFQFTQMENGQRVVDSDLDATGYNFVESRIVFDDSDFIRHNEVLTIEVARGCIFKCKFCSYRMTGKTKNDYIKSKDVLYEELIDNYERFGTTKYIFADDTYNESVSKIQYMLDIFKRLPFKLEFAAYLRHDLIVRFPEMADILLESGLKACVFGLETLNHQAAKIIGKGMHPDRTVEGLRWLREEKGWKGNVIMASGFIVGLPTENEETTSAWMKRIVDPSFPLDTFTFLPLNLNPNASRISKSPFELDYAKYGYWFDHTRGPHWINEHWCFEDAARVAKIYQDMAYEAGRTKMPSFHSMIAQNYGYTWEQLHNCPAKDFGYSMFDQTLLQADDYFQKLLTQ